MDSHFLVKRLDELQVNLETLYQKAIASSPSSGQLLAHAFKELGYASEELMVASEQITLQSEKLQVMQKKLDRERDKNDNLTDIWSSAFLITNERITIVQANREAGLLFEIEPQFLLNKPLEILFTPSERRLFPQRMQQFAEGRSQQWLTTIKPRYGQEVRVFLRAAPVWKQEQQMILWNILTPTFSQAVQSLPDSQKLTQHFSQGDLIPLEPDTVWLVAEGIIKLSSEGEKEEVLLGLVGPSMPFGACLTSLPIYQATALTQSVLIPLSFAQIKETPLLQDFVSQLIQRLQQTETLLNISGQRHVQKRLDYLLLWLKENFGKPCPQGTQLTVRLTHQELADACCTTRVTISRLISKLKQQGKLAYDDVYYLILRE